MSSFNSALFNSTLFGGFGTTPNAPNPVFVSDLINGALRLIGRLGPGRSAGSSETSAAIYALNEMIDSWNIQRLTIYQIRRDVYTLIAGQQSYQIGVGSTDWQGPRPTRIQDVTTITQANSQPLELPIAIMTVDDWASLSVKSTTSTLVTRVYFDNAYPVATLNFWPVPSVTNQVALYTWEQLPMFAASDNIVVVPPGYIKALRFNLAVVMAHEYPLESRQAGLVLPPWVEMEAIKSLGWVKANNTPVNDLVCDPVYLPQNSGVFNWLTGDSNTSRRS